MTNRGWLAAGAAMAMLAMSGQAMAATCITRAEIAGMMGYAMPSMIEAVRDQCRPNLPADAFVATGVDAMIEIYRADQAALWPAARAAFMKFGDTGNARDARMMAKMPDSALQPMVEAMVPALIQEEIRPEQCRDIDTLLSAFSSMSPQQTANMFAAIMALSGKTGGAGGEPGQPAVCAE